MSQFTTHPWSQENNILLLTMYIFTQAAFENTYRIYAVDMNSETSSAWMSSVFPELKAFHK